MRGGVRIYAVAYGVAMLSSDRDGIGGLASSVYRRVFAKGAPPAHILLRDYARGVVERAVRLGAHLGVDLALARPPYQSELPDIPAEDAIARLTAEMESTQASGDADTRAWSAIRFSVERSDFAIYVIGVNIGSNDGYESYNWLTRTADESPARLDLRIAQRYILNRVVSLGWSTEALGEFDAYAVGRMSYTRSGRKAERLGKKYQWIAYHEIMAYIADRYQYCPRREDAQRYVSAYPITATAATTVSDYDCSVERDETGTLYLPIHAIIKDCRLSWTGTGGRYVDPNGDLAAYSPSECETGVSALLIRADILQEYAAERNLALRWAVIGEKQTLGEFGQPYGWLNMQGAYALRDGEPIGKQGWTYTSPSQ